MTTQTKHCHQCNTTKTGDQFYRDRRAENGLQSKCKACEKTYRESNREAIAAQKKCYHQANREEIIARKVEYNRNRLANDPTLRWIKKIRVNLNHILHGRSSHPEALELLGCTRQEYRDHLESKFTDGMSWDNYGKWQVDHIIPVSAFDQNKLDERAICWRYSNTQPLWAKDNRAKGKTIPTE